MSKKNKDLKSIMDKVMEDLKKKHLNNGNYFTYTVIGDVEQVTEEIKKFNDCMTESLKEYKSKLR